MKKQNLIFIADCETSYINEEQLTLHENERQRYADGIYIRNINESTGILFNNGKNTMKDFINYIIGLAKEYNKTHNIKIGFHNLQYDWSYICYYLNDNGYFNEKALHSFSYDEINDGNMLYSTTLYYSYRSNKKDKKGNMTYHNYKIDFFDTYKLFPTSVEKLGKAIRLSKGKDFDYDKIRDYNYRYTPEEKEYIKTDVDIVVEYYNQSPDYMKEKITLASNALNLYKNKFIPKHFINNQGNEINLEKYSDDNQIFKILFPNKFFNNDICYIHEGLNYDGTLRRIVDKTNFEECNNIFSKYYYGGMTMVNPLYKGKILINENYSNKDNLINYCKNNNREYKITHGKEIILDVNSLYPFIMNTANLPYGTPIIVENPSMSILDKHYKTNFIFLEIKNIYGHLKENKLPLIPKNKKDKLGAETLYKTELYGDSLGTNRDEWKLINEHYEIFSYEITKAYIFNSVSNIIFSEYVHYFTNMKIKYNKYLLNGEPNPEYNEVKRTNAKFMQNTLYGKYGTKIDKKSVIRMFKNDEWITVDKEEKRKKEYIYPIIASAITSYARIYMMSIIDNINYEQFVYMDTDSIHMIENDKNNLKTLTEKGLINKAELGKLDNENSTRCSIYLAPKKYAFIDLEEKENGKNIDGELIIKCGGLPDKAKEKITIIENFYYGYETNCKLQRKFVKGGIDLAETKFRILKPKESVYNCLDVIGV